MRGSQIVLEDKFRPFCQCRFFARIGVTEDIFTLETGWSPTICSDSQWRFRVCRRGIHTRQKQGNAVHLMEVLCGMILEELQSTLAHLANGIQHQIILVVKHVFIIRKGGLE